MFRTKANLQAWLNTIRPWAAGVDDRGWMRSDFQTIATVDDQGPLFTDIEAVKDHRTDLAHVIFPVVLYNVTVLDRLFLPQEVLNEVIIMNQKLAAFNAVLDAVNATEDRETRWQRMILLHVGTIGTVLGPGIHEQFRRLEATLNG